MTSKRRFNVYSDSNSADILDEYTDKNYNQFTGFEDLCDLLNDYDSKLSGLRERGSVNSWQSIYDNIVNVERKLILLEKIVNEMDYIGRCNFEVNENDYKKERERQFLIEIQTHYERLFKEAYYSLNIIKKVMGKNE